MPSHQAAWYPKQVLKRSAVDVANMGVDDGCVQKNPQTFRTCHLVILQRWGGKRTLGSQRPA